MKSTEIQDKVRAARESGEARGRRGYPEQVRAMVVAHSRSLLQRGGSLAQASTDTGIALVTVRKWLAAEDAATRTETSRRRSTRGFRQVRVVESTTPTRTTTMLVVHGPGQLRIEGLTVDALAELLARLA